MSENVPNGISESAYATAARMVSELEQAGYKVAPWWEWGAPESYTIDFNITADDPRLSTRTISGSTIVVKQGETDRVLLRLPTIDGDTDVNARAVGQATIEAVGGMGDWATTRIPTNYFGDGWDVHIEARSRHVDLPAPMQAARQAAQVGDAFEEALTST